MVTAIVSVLTGIPVRKDVAMTGEITLRGRVLPIGGLKEKLLAALRAGIKKVLIPEDNVKDLADISDNVKNALEITPVARMDDVLDVVTWPVAVKGASITLAQEVRRGGEVLVKAEVRVAFISEGRAKPIPKSLRLLMRADLES